MSTPYVGEIRLFGGNYAPLGWAFCNGALLSIPSNDVLFALIGTTYGGDGTTTFALPDLRGRLPVHQNASTYVMGQTAGVENVTLTTAQIPAHSHALNATTATGNVTTPGATVMLATPVEPGVKTTLYVVPGTSTVNLTPMAPASIGSTGGSQPHSNMMPTLGLNYIIALQGVFPSRN
jgi:microcystin-dependent protein